MNKSVPRVSSQRYLARVNHSCLVISSSGDGCGEPDLPTGGAVARLCFSRVHWVGAAMIASLQT